MENIFEHAAFERALSPTRISEFNRMFQQLYAYRLQEIMIGLQQQQQFNQNQQLWTSAATTTPPSSPASNPEQTPTTASFTATEKRHSRTKIRFNPYQQQRRSKHLSAIQSNDSIEVELSYHEKMARNFYPSTGHRTPKEIKRLERNAYSSRVWRAKTRALQTVLTTEHDEEAYQNRSHKLVVAQKRAYVNALNQQLGLPQRDLAAEWEMVREQYEASIPRSEQL